MVWLSGPPRREKSGPNFSPCASPPTSKPRALGQKSWKIIFRHILPNAAAPIVVTAVLGVPEAILAEAGLSFLGFGVQPPQATWGNIIADGKTYILDAWWLILFPGLAILVAALSFYLTGDALRQAVETRSERQ